MEDDYRKGFPLWRILNFPSTRLVSNRLSAVPLRCEEQRGHDHRYGGARLRVVIHEDVVAFLRILPISVSGSTNYRGAGYW